MAKKLRQHNALLTFVADDFKLCACQWQIRSFDFLGYVQLHGNIVYWENILNYFGSTAAGRNSVNHIKTIAFLCFLLNHCRPTQGTHTFDFKGQGYIQKAQQIKEIIPVINTAEFTENCCKFMGRIYHVTLLYCGGGDIAILIIRHLSVIAPDLVGSAKVRSQLNRQHLAISCLDFVTAILSLHKKSEYMWVGCKGGKVINHSMLFGEEKQLPFEDEVFAVPSDYHNYLTLNYGDYMAPLPEDEQKGHELKLGEIEWKL